MGFFQDSARSRLFASIVLLSVGNKVVQIDACTSSLNGGAYSTIQRRDLQCVGFSNIRHGLAARASHGVIRVGLVTAIKVS